MLKRSLTLITAVSALAASGSIMAQTPPPDLRLGIIGLDTSHAVEFTMRLNDAANPNHIPGGRVVAAFPVGSPDLPESAGRIEGYTKTLQEKYGVKIVGGIVEVCTAVDAVMVLSLDGRPHLEQARQVITLKKPLFLDKPVAASLKDAVEIYRLADAAKTPVFSASAVRWHPGVVELAAAEPGPAKAALSYGPAPLLPHHPALFFYGIHPTEALFTVMGPGCASAASSSTPGATVVTGIWDGGRAGTLHAIHSFPMGSPSYKVIRFGEKEAIEQKSPGDYTPMLREIIKFFQTGKPPVSAAETLEIYAFMEAAEESKRQNGKPVAIREILQKAGCPDAWILAKSAQAKNDSGKPKGR